MIWLACSALLVTATGATTWGQSTETGALEPPSDAYFFQDVAWSPDGRWIAFSRYGGGDPYDPEDWEILVSRADGTESRVIARHATWVSWTPDGERLAFGSPMAGNWDLYAVGREGGEPSPLTSHEADDRAPSWSPDGSEVAFTSNRDGNSEIYVLDLGSGETRRLTSDEADDHNPQWSPDGKTVVSYRARAGGSADQLYAISSDGSAERALTDDVHLNIFPAFLADGRVSFTRHHQDSGEERLMLLDPQTRTARPLGPPGAFFGRWSPDGRRIAFIAGNWPIGAVYLMDVDSGSIRKILN